LVNFSIRMFLYWWHVPETCSHFCNRAELDRLHIKSKSCMSRTRGSSTNSLRRKVFTYFHKFNPEKEPCRSDLLLSQRTSDARDNTLTFRWDLCSASESVFQVKIKKFTIKSHKSVQENLVTAHEFWVCRTRTEKRHSLKLPWRRAFRIWLYSLFDAAVWLVMMKFPFSSRTVRRSWQRRMQSSMKTVSSVLPNARQRVEQFLLIRSKS
jgi:hypothetical protein